MKPLKPFRPCCAKVGPTTLLNPQEVANVVFAHTIARGIGPFGFIYEGTTLCTRCGVERHTFRNPITKRITVLHRQWGPANA